MDLLVELIREYPRASFAYALVLGFSFGLGLVGAIWQSSCQFETRVDPKQIPWSW